MDSVSGARDTCYTRKFGVEGACFRHSSSHSWGCGLWTRARQVERPRGRRSSRELWKSLRVCRRKRSESAGKGDSSVFAAANSSRYFGESGWPSTPPPHHHHQLSKDDGRIYLRAKNMKQVGLVGGAGFYLVGAESGCWNPIRRSSTNSWLDPWPCCIINWYWSARRLHVVKEEETFKSRIAISRRVSSPLYLLCVRQIQKVKVSRTEFVDVSLFFVPFLLLIKECFIKRYTLWQRAGQQHADFSN